MEIVLIVLFFIALLLYIVWSPFFKSTNKNTTEVAPKDNLRDETNVELYREHKAEIEKDFSDGRVDEENYQYLLAELDNSLLQDIEAAEKESKIVVSNKSFSLFWPLSLSLFIIAFSVALYLKQGTLMAFIASPSAQNSSQQAQMSSEQQVKAQKAEALAYIKEIQQHLEKNPDDSEAWYNLGQTLVSVGEFDMAITAYEQVIRIEGEQADLIGAIAQANYYRNNQQIDEQVQNLIDRALALDINDPSTNILLGMHNFISKKYEKAISYWQRVIDANRQGVNINALQEAVGEAKSRLGMPSMNSEQSSPTEPEVTGPELNISVSLSDKVAQQLAKGEDKVVFVYAIPSDGQRMPLAALKLMASDLPKVITLSNKNAMSPASNLSSVSEVHIYAVVSQQGSVGIKSGDYKAELKNISVDNTETISLIVDSFVE
jgi:cytochrome c-type biogenesis protein CcmH